MMFAQASPKEASSEDGHGAVRDTTLLLAAHGDRGPDKSNAWLWAHARELAGRNLFAEVAVGFLKGEPSIEHALREAAKAGARDVLIYPMFISEGYFMGILRERIAAKALDHAPRMLTPFGADPGLPALMMQRSLEAADKAQFDPAKTRLLVISHGSQVSPVNARATHALIASLAAMRRFARVEPGFIEEPPLLADALGADSGPTVVAGFLTGEGMHAQTDVPQAIAAKAPQAIYTGAIGTDRAVPDMILAAVIKDVTGT